MSIITRSLPALAVTATLGLSAAPALATTSHHGGSSSDGTSHSRHSGNAYAYGKYRTCGLDRAWLKAITRGDLAEIATGTLATQKGTSQGVKDLGAMLVTDHSKHLELVKALAARVSFTLPTAPSPTQQWSASVLATFSGAAFDQQWISLQIAAHLENIEKTQDEVSDGCNRSVRALAKATLPTLQAHLAAAQKLAGGAGTGTGTTTGTGTPSGGSGSQSDCDSGAYDDKDDSSSSYSGGHHHGDGCCDDDDSDGAARS
jgi:putative membrane protein